MFWKFNLLTSSHVDTLLEREDVTLRELMDEDDILQECKAQNRKLIDFLVQPENMEDMVRMITKEPDEDTAERFLYKYPNTACELLTSDVSQVNDALANDRELIDQLYSFLESERPLNPLLASFFSKVMGLLITRKSEMIFEYLKGQKDFVGRLLHHIGTSAIMDLLLRLITCIESPEIRRAVIEWLSENQIVQRLVDCIVPSNEEDIHCNAAQSLCDIVRLGREQMMQMQDLSNPDPLLTTMEMQETVSKVLKNMFDLEQNESVIVNGLFVIHTLLEVRRQGHEGLVDPMAAVDADHLSQGISNVLAAVIPRLKDFHGLLITPPKQRYSTMPTSMGILEPPLGNTRLQVTKLMTVLLAINMAAVNIELVNLNTLQALLDLYFFYKWNNFLHTQVEQCITLVLTNPPAEIDGATEQPLLQQLFTDFRLPQRLLDEWEENDHQQSQDRGKRRGYMGHLTKIANTLSASSERGCNCEMIKELWTEVPEECKQKWDTFVLGTLADVNRKNTVEYHGHPLASSSEDDDADFKDIPFPQDTAMQQAFSDYQLQQMTSNFVDQFGFNEEEFAEQEEKIDAPFTDRISSINFSIQANEVKQPKRGVYPRACNDRIQQFDDDDSDEDIWVEKPLAFDKNTQPMRSGRLQGQAARVNSSDDSTDSEEELESPHSISQQPSCVASTPVSIAGGPSSCTPTVTVPTVMAATEKMDVDTSEVPCSTNGESSGPSEPSDMETSAPWESEAAPPQGPREGWASFDKLEASSEDGWADFRSFSDISSAGSAPRSSSPIEMDTSEASRASVYLLGKGSLEEESSGSVGSTEDSPRQKQEPVGSSDIKVEDLEQSDPDAVSVSVVSSTRSIPSAAEAADVAVSSTSSEAESQESTGTEVNMKAAGAADTVTPQLDNTPVDSSISASSAPHSSLLSSSQQENKDDDLGANFDFLTGSGLMCKRSDEEVKSGAETGDQGSIDGNAVQDLHCNSVDLEEARAQAKEAMEQFDAAASMAAAEASVGNGPV